MVIVVMGPAGPGTSRVATALAERLGWARIDTDDDRVAANVVPHSRLRAIVERALDRREPLVLVCSVLTAGQRELLADGLRTVRFIHLVEGPTAVREEPGAPTIALDASAAVDTIVGHIRLELGV